MKVCSVAATALVAAVLGQPALIQATLAQTVEAHVAAAKAAAGKDHALEGLLLSLVTQATLTATDTPDTRNWATLPARMAFSRVWLPAGTRTVQLHARGADVTKKVSIKPGGFAVVNLTVLE